MTWFTRHASVRRDGGLPDPFDNDFFESAFSMFDSPTLVGKSDSGFPKTNLLEDDTKFIVELGLSGWKKDELRIEVLGDNLVVAGESKESSTQGGKYLRRELKRSKFSKTIVLGKDLDRDNIEATYEDGLLTVTVPKLQKSEPRSTRINIK
jgi:HSP20 family protein